MWLEEEGLALIVGDVANQWGKSRVWVKDQDGVHGCWCFEITKGWCRKHPKVRIKQGACVYRARKDEK